MNFSGLDSINWRAFKNATTGVPISLEDLEREYCLRTDQPYPITEMVFARSWMLFRVSLSRRLPFSQIFIRGLTLKLAIISQGIAARYVTRQASSEAAHLHVSLFPLFGQLAKKVLEDEGIFLQSKSRL